MKDGKINRSDAPGFGIHLSDATKAKFPFVPDSGEFNSVPGKIMPEDMSPGVCLGLLMQPMPRAQYLITLRRVAPASIH